MKPSELDAPSVTLARWAGVLYLVIIVCAGFSEGYVRMSLVSPGDAARTAAAIRGGETLFRVGFVTDVVAFLSDVAVAVLFYALLKPVGQVLAMMAGAFRLAQATILGLNMLNHLSAALLLGGATYLVSLDPSELESLALLSMEQHRYGYLIGQMFFGIHCVIAGFLIKRAWYFPTFLGILIGVAGLGYLADGLMYFLFPEAAPSTSPYFIAPVVVGELTLCGWLLVKGVRTAEPTA